MANRFSQQSHGSRVSDASEDDDEHSSSSSSSSSNRVIVSKKGLVRRLRQQQQEYDNDEVEESSEDDDQQGSLEEEDPYRPKGGYRFEGTCYDHGRGATTEELKHASEVRVTEKRACKAYYERLQKEEAEAKRERAVQETLQREREECERECKEWENEFRSDNPSMMEEEDEAIQQQECNDDSRRRSKRSTKGKSAKYHDESEDNEGTDKRSRGKGKRGRKTQSDSNENDSDNQGEDEGITNEDLVGEDASGLGDDATGDTNNDTVGDDGTVPPEAETTSKNTDTEVQPAPPAATTKKSSTKSTTTRKKATKKKAHSTEAPLLGSKPSRPIVSKLSAKPTKKDLLKGTVSKNVNKKNFSKQVAIANERITALEAHIDTERRELEDTHSHLETTVETAYDYIDEQDEFISWAKRDQELKDEEMTKMKDQIRDLKIENAKLQAENRAYKKIESMQTQSIQELRKDVTAAKKDNKQLSIDDQIELDTIKTKNAIRLNREKEYAKVDAHNEKKDCDELRTEKKFQGSKSGYRRNQSGRGAWREIGSDNYSRHRSNRERGRSRSGDRHRGRSYDRRSLSYDSWSDSSDCWDDDDSYDSRSRYKSHGRSHSTHHSRRHRDRSPSYRGRSRPSHHDRSTHRDSHRRSQSTHHSSQRRSQSTHHSSQRRSQSTHRSSHSQSTHHDSHHSSRNDSHHRSQSTSQSGKKKQRSPAQCGDDEQQYSDKSRARAFVDNGSISPRKHGKPKKSRMSNSNQERSIKKKVSSDLDDNEDNEKEGMASYQNADVVYETSNASANKDTNNLVYTNELEVAETLRKMNGAQ